MSPEEARWWKSCLSTISTPDLTPAINIGSSTADYRVRVNPHVDLDVFRPLVARGVDIIHVDMKAAPGVDFVGDITSPEALRKLKELRARAVFCNNSLQHVKDRARAFVALRELVVEGGYVFLSSPRAYPLVQDPFDSGYRPTVDDLVDEMEGFRVVDGAVIDFGCYARQLRRKPWLLARDSHLLIGGLASHRRWEVLRRHYAFFFRRYLVTCVTLQKVGTRRTRNAGSEP